MAAVCAVLASGCEDFERLKQLKPRKVTVRATDISYLPDGGRLPVPRKAEGAAPCEVAVDGLLQAGWQTSYGEWVEDGVCEVHDVQPGETLVRVPELKFNAARKAYVVTKLNEVDLGLDVGGRPQSGAEAGTAVTLDVTGALPFTSKYEVALYVPAFGRVNTSVTVPDGHLGMTSFPATFDWKGFPLLQPDEPVELFQYRPTMNATGDQLLSVLERHGAATVQPIDTRGVRGGVALSAVAPGPTLPAIDVDASALHDLMKTSFPDATFIGALASEEAVVGAVSDPLPVQQRFTVSDTALLSLPAVSIDPLPGVAWRWQLAVQSAVERRITAAAPGTVSSAVTIVGPADNRAWLASTAIGPALRIRERPSGRTDRLEGELASATPVIVWDEPTTGKPNTYVFQPRRVELTNGTARLVSIDALISVSAPEVHVPPGMLSAQTSYVFIVTAENCTATDPLRPRPGAVQPTCGLTTSASAVFVTP